jgi:hypothetical protein
MEAIPSPDHVFSIRASIITHPFFGINKQDPNTTIQLEDVLYQLMDVDEGDFAWFIKGYDYHMILSHLPEDDFDVFVLLSDILRKLNFTHKYNNREQHPDEIFLECDLYLKIYRREDY